MQPDGLFLRFDDRHEAISVLSTIGIRPLTDGDGVDYLPCDGVVPCDGTMPGDGAVGEIHYTIEVVSGDGIICRPSGEMANFEGEQVALTEPLSGYHISLLWGGDIPPALHAHLVSPDSPAVIFSG